MCVCDGEVGAERGGIAAPSWVCECACGCVCECERLPVCLYLSLISLSLSLSLCVCVWVSVSVCVEDDFTYAWMIVSMEFFATKHQDHSKLYTMICRG